MASNQPGTLLERCSDSIVWQPSLHQQHLGPKNCKFGTHKWHRTQPGTLLETCSDSIVWQPSLPQGQAKVRDPWDPPKASNSTWHSCSNMQCQHCLAAKPAQGTCKKTGHLGPTKGIELNLAQLQQHAVTALFGSQACPRGRQKIGTLGTHQRHRTQLGTAAATCSDSTVWQPSL